MTDNDTKKTTGEASTPQQPNEQGGATSNKTAPKTASSTTQEFEVLSVERRGEKFSLQVRGEIVVTPTEADREKYLNTAVGSRIKLDVKEAK